MRTKTPMERYLEKLKKEAEEKRKEEAMKDAEAIVNECVAKRAKYYEIVIIYAFHTFAKTKFGRKLCREFYLYMITIYLKMLKQWQSSGDDSHFWVMEERLKADGINVDELIREGNKLAEEMESQDEKAVSDSN